jgi:hypothetical protein
MGGGVQPIGAFHELRRVAGLSEAGIGVQCANLRPGVNDPGNRFRLFARRFVRASFLNAKQKIPLLNPKIMANLGSNDWPGAHGI